MPSSLQTPDPNYFFPERSGPSIFDQNSVGVGYFVWDPNYYYDSDSGIHYLIFSRWPKSATFATGWKTDCSFHYATASTRLGPYTYGGQLLAGAGGGAWDSLNVHNVKICKFDGDSTWYMYYFGNSASTGTQQIGVATASSITGPYTRFGSTPIVPLTGVGSGAWDSDGASNPTVVKNPADGLYYMLYKGINASAQSRIGLATASSPTGPWTKFGSAPVVSTTVNTEDPHLWIDENGIFNVVFKDLAGTYVATNDCAWRQSADCKTWTEPTNGHHAWRVCDWGSGLARAERPNLIKGASGEKLYLLTGVTTTSDAISSIRMTTFIPGSPLQAIADTYIKASPDNTKNYGGATTLAAGFAASMIQRALVNFDYSSIPANATITRAWLIWHYSAKTGSADPVFQIRPLIQDWVEGTANGTSPGDSANWDTYNGATAWPGGAGALVDAPTLMGSVFVPNTDTLGRYSVPLTGLTLENVAKGFLLRNSNEALSKLITFGARGNTKPGQRPMLVLEWTSPGPTYYNMNQMAGQL